MCDSLRALRVCVNYWNNNEKHVIQESNKTILGTRSLVWIFRDKRIGL